MWTVSRTRHLAMQCFDRFVYLSPRHETSLVPRCTQSERRSDREKRGDASNDRKDVCPSREVHLFFLRSNPSRLNHGLSTSELPQFNLTETGTQSSNK